MTNIKEFVEEVIHSRKRTGIILIQEETTLTELRSLDITVIDLATHYRGDLTISENELCKLITKISLNKATAILNLEMFLSIRYQEARYLNFLLSKICILEPLEPIFFVFYSKILYEKFKNQYLLNKATDSHYYEDAV